jgi:effector-binding domain-containing protein
MDDAGSVQMYSINLRHQYKCLTAVMRTNTQVEGIPAWLGNAYATIEAEANKRGARLTGPPFARFHRQDDGTFWVEAGFPVDRIIPTGNGVVASTLPEAETITTTHVGPYEELEPAYAAMGSWLAEHKCEAEGDPWEIYFSDPTEVPDMTKWRTEVVQPCRPA